MSTGGAVVETSVSLAQKWEKRDKKKALLAAQKFQELVPIPDRVLAVWMEWVPPQNTLARKFFAMDGLAVHLARIYLPTADRLSQLPLFEEEYVGTETGWLNIRIGPVSDQFHTSDGCTCTVHVTLCLTKTEIHVTTQKVVPIARRQVVGLCVVCTISSSGTTRCPAEAVAEQRSKECCRRNRGTAGCRIR